MLIKIARLPTMNALASAGEAHPVSRLTILAIVDPSAIFPFKESPAPVKTRPAQSTQ
jgi:hypothetical protein